MILRRGAYVAEVNISLIRKTGAVAFLFLQSLFALSLICSVQAAPRMVRVAILSGQSNMADGWPADTLASWPQAWFDDSTAAGAANSTWKGLNLPAEGSIGVQAGVAEVLRAAYPEDQIAILKVSQGATGVSFWANAGSPGYEALTSRIAAVKDRLAAQQAAGEIAGFSFVGFFWMQGENEIDPWNTSGTRLYFETFQKIPAAVRAFAGVPELPVILGRTSNAYAPSTIREANGDYRAFPVAAGTRPFAADSEFINSGVMRGQALFEAYSDFVRTSQIGWTLYDSHSAWVDVDDLPLVDYYHFPNGDPGKITLGRRMGRAALRLNGVGAVDELKVDVGPHRWVHPGTHTLTASVVSGPASPSSVQWRRLVGDSSATLDTPNALSTSVTITEPGTYSFQAVVGDGTLRHAGTVNLYVLPASDNLPPYGTSPVFYAPHPGAPVTLVPNIINPDGDPLTYAWKGTAPFADPSQVFGQGKTTISSTSGANPVVRFSWPGAQILRLQVSDGVTRPDGNASGWINVPVFVGMDSTTLPDYSARWSFNEPSCLLAEIRESSQTQVNNGVTQDANTPVGGKSGFFNGTSYLQNDIARWDNQVLFSKAFTNYTVSLWMNPAAPSTGTQVLYEEGGSSQDSAVTLRLSGGNLEAGIFQAGTLHTVSTPAPAAGVWTHVAFTYDGAAATMKLWINGQVAATTQGLPFSTVAKRSLASAIGAMLQQDAFNNSGGAGSAADFYTGKLDEVRVYERTLDATAIDNLYKSGVVATPGGTVSLGSSSVSVAENAASVAFTVARTGGAVGPASVFFCTSNGSAAAGSDYVGTSGSVNWVDGESGSKSIAVPLIDDAVYEGNESFSLTLSAASGALLGSPYAATVTIVDNEAVNQPPAISVVTPTQSSVQLPNGAGGMLFDTTVTDDGVSGIPVSCLWTTVAGPASAVFGSPSGADTSASFPASGTYALRLTASDGVVSTSRDFTVVVGGTPGRGNGPTSGLILYYKFDEASGTTITDSAGTHTTTGVTSATWSAPGKFGGAYDIGGSGSRAFNPANQADLNFTPSSSAFTISTWVKTTSTGTYSAIFGKGDTSPTANTQFRIWSPSSASKLQGTNGNAQSLEYPTANPPLNDGTWHLVTLVNWNSSGTWKSRIYHDTTQALEWNTGSNAPAVALLKIGALSSGYNPWTGQLDDFRVYNRALSATEVADLFSANTTNFAPVVAIASAADTSVNSPANLDGTVSDDGLPNPPASLSAQWSKVSGPGNVIFGDQTSTDTSATAGSPGTYLLRLAVSDGEVTGYSDVVFHVTAAPGYPAWAAGIAWAGADATPVSDADSDGLSNLLEYALGGDPISSGAAPYPVIQMAGAKLQLSFFRARGELIYNVQSSPDLTSWTDILYSPTAAGMSQTVTDTVDLGANCPRRFMRLQVGQPQGAVTQ